MRFERFFARRITFRNQRSVSALTVRLAVLSMAVAVAVMEISLSFVQGFDDAIRDKVVGFGAHIRIGHYLESQDDTLSTLPRHADFATALSKRFPEVKAVTPYIGVFGMLRAHGDMEAIYAKGVGNDYDWRFFQQSLRGGHTPNFVQIPDTGGVVPPAEILISQMQADHLRLSAGEKAALLFFDGQNLKRRPVVIAGIYETGLEEFDSQVALCDMAMLQGVNGWGENEVSGFEVKMHAWPNPNSADSLAAAITSELPMAYEAISISHLYPELFDWLKLQHQNVDFILLLMTIVAVINMASVVLILIIERTRTIGLLRAMGLSAWRTQKIFLWNVFFLMLAGIVLGNILGLGLLASQDYFGWLHVNQATYFIDTVPVAWTWEKFAIVNAGVVVIGTICMILPTAVIARITPIRAIRFS